MTGTSDLLLILDTREQQRENDDQTEEEECDFVDFARDLTMAHLGICNQDLEGSVDSEEPRTYDEQVPVIELVRLLYE